MKARLLLRERIPFGDDAFAELVLWKLAISAPGSTHGLKYRLAFILHGECVLRYDNEAGKGDHKHFVNEESAYVFESPEKLVRDFLSDARGIYREDGNT